VDPKEQAMCGIAGILSLDGSPVRGEELGLMCSAIVHRGPDDLGGYCDGTAGLAMRRLSIIDLDGGRQPICNEDGSVWVVFNGEIYNFAQLRREMEAKGHCFHTQADTEAIVHLYEEYGSRCVERMRGMFAFAVWDQGKRRLLLARDRVGIKPLYYGVSSGRLVFASELKAILQLPGASRSLDWTAVAHLFAFLATPLDRSILQGIRKLEPGHVLTVSPGDAPRTSRYWDLHAEPDHGRSEEQTVESLREALDEAVRLHLVSDVPLGAFLSGGIDSSTVVASMARMAREPVKTFSIGFHEEDFSELPYARAVAAALGTEHHDRVLEPDVLGILDDLVFYLDEPFGDSSSIPTYMVSKLAAEHVKVVLSGDGGDELFAGYDRYQVEGRERRYDRLPALARKALGAAASLAPEGMKGRNFLRHVSLAGPARYLDAMTLFPSCDQGKLFAPELRALFAGCDPWREVASAVAKPNGHWLSSLQYFDLNHYLPLDILTKVDRMSMAHSIEARVPLLDHKLIELAASIPAELKLKDGTGKYILKRAMRGILPDEILDRPKRGFAIPLGRWFRGRLHGFVRDLLLSETTRARGIFDTAYVERILARPSGRDSLELRLWTLISFELWCRRFLDASSARATARADSPFPAQRQPLWHGAVS
jgi:asparagine synthase (glutamine-hydrolysing)